MRLATIVVSCAALFGVVPGLLAQDRVETASGQVYVGKVLSDDGKTVEFETSAGMRLNLPYDNLTLPTRYRLRNVRTPAEADAQLELAEWCVEQTLYREAGRHFRAALDADAARAQEINQRVAKARTTAGRELLDRAKALQEAGRRDDARQILSTIVQELPLEDVAKQAAALIAEDTERRKQQTFERKAPASQDDAPVPEGQRAKRKSGEDFSDEARATFKPVVEAYYAMLDRTQEGLLESKSSGAIKAFEKALASGDKARKETDGIRPRGAQDEEIAEALEIVDQKLEEALVEARIHLADVYLLRDSYKQAAKVIDQGLAEYSANLRLRSAKERITVAATSGSDGLVIVRRGGLGRR